MIGISHFLLISACLFGLGIIGVICRRNALVVFMSIELMLNAANLTLVGFSRVYGHADGHVLAFFVIALAAVEVAVGLSILLTVAGHTDDIDTQKMRFLKG